MVPDSEASFNMRCHANRFASTGFACTIYPM